MSGIRHIVAALILLAAALLGSQPVQATDATAQLLLGNPSGAVADPASPTNELIVCATHCWPTPAGRGRRTHGGARRADVR